MELSCLPVSLFPKLITKEMSLYEWAVLGKEAGLDYIDLSVLFFHSRTRREILAAKESLGRAGMRVAMITTYPDFADGDPVQRRRELAHTFSDIELASELGAGYLRITAGQKHWGADKAATLDRVTECFLRCAEYAKQAGVKLVYENHAKPGAWDEFDFCFETDIFLRLSEKLRDSEVRINFDTANTAGYGDDPLPVFKAVFDRVETIHAADIALPGEMRYTEIGAGCAPIREVLAYAKAHGFDGLISIEEASMHGADGILRGAKTLRRIWEAV